MTQSLATLRATAEAATPGPWTAAPVKGWGEDPSISAPSWPRPIATMLPHPDRYYRQVTRKIGGEDVTTFAPETADGEARRRQTDAELTANAAHIAAWHPTAAQALLARLERAEAALREIEGMHVPDQPASADYDERIWVMKHVGKMRGVARAYFAATEEDRTHG